MRHIYAMKLRELAKIAGTYAAFRRRSRRVITSLHNVPMATGEIAALVWSYLKNFQLSAKLYVTFLQRKCRDYEIMQALHILRRNLQFMLWKCGIFEKMRPPHEYADFGWLCVELCDCIITFSLRDWLVIFRFLCVFCVCTIGTTTQVSATQSCRETGTKTKNSHWNYFKSTFHCQH